MAFQEIFQTVMYTLIFSVIGIVLAYLVYCKIKYGRFFEEEDAKRDTNVQ
jgi:heme/copper-type cytochrome/quinol oxidase subunit 2